MPLNNQILVSSQSNVSSIYRNWSGNYPLIDYTIDDKEVIYCSSDYDRSLVLCSDGTLYWIGYWIGNYFAKGEYTEPTEVLDKKFSFLSFRSNNYFSAIDQEGYLWGMGINTAGQLGDGTKTSRSSPVRIGSGNNWSKVYNGRCYCTMAIKTDGSLWSWGANYNGELGDGTKTGKSSPIQIGGGTNWASVSLSDLHCLALKTDGTLWSWGQNSSGELGLGDVVGRSSPVQVGSDTNWAKISAGRGEYSYAIKTDGTLWRWGDGYMLYGSDQNLSSPTMVGSDTDWSDVNAGYEAAYYLKEDSSIWGSGEADSGEFWTDPGVVFVSTPIILGAEAGWSILDNGTAWATGGTVKIL